MAADELYLVAHKVRGEPAFDVAVQMHCPRCEVDNTGDYIGGCTECNDKHYWWIIPTSGHRAYPSDYAPLSGFYSSMGKRILDVLALPDPSLRDHYAVSAAPAPKKLSLNLADLGL